MANDIFCTSYRVWKDNSSVIYEDDVACAILSITPVTPGQAIIFPRRHVESFIKLDGDELEGLMHAVPETFEAIQQIYDTDIERIASFYQSLQQNPPFVSAGTAAEKMLNHLDLRVRPIAYNMGMNDGEAAGQLIKHLHLHLFPRRARSDGTAKGIVTAMGSIV